MTVDELSVRISIVADEAIAALDGLTQRMQVLTQTLESKHKVELDVTKAKDEVNQLEKVLEGVGDAVKDQSMSIVNDLYNATNGAAGLGKMLGAVANGWKSIAMGGMIELVVEAVGWGISKLAGLQAEAARAEGERKAALAESIEAEEAGVKRLTTLEKRYEALAAKKAKTALNLEESAELASILKELNESFGIQAAAVGNDAEAFGRLGQEIEAVRQAGLQTLYMQQNTATWDAITATQQKFDALNKRVQDFNNISQRVGKIWGDISSVVINSQRDLDARMLQISQHTGTANSSSISEFVAVVKGIYKELELSETPILFQDLIGCAIKQAEADVMQATPEFNDWLAKYLSQSLTALSLNEGIEVPEEFAGNILSAMESAFKQTSYDSFEEMKTDVESVLASICDAMTDSAIGEAAQTLNNYMMSAMGGMDITDPKDKEAFAGAWETMLGDSSALVVALTEVNGVTEEMSRRIIASAFNMNGLGESVESAIDTLNASGETLEAGAEAFTALGDEADDTAQRLAEYTEKTEALNRQTEKFGQQKRAITTLKDLSAQLKKCEKDSNEYSDAMEDVGKYLEDAGISAEDVGDDVGKLDDAITASEKAMSEAASGMAGDLNGIIGWAERTKQEIVMKGNVDVNTDPGIMALNSLITVARIALAVLSALGLAHPPASFLLYTLRCKTAKRKQGGLCI